MAELVIKRISIHTEGGEVQIRVARQAAAAGASPTRNKGLSLPENTWISRLDILRGCPSLDQKDAGLLDRRVTQLGFKNQNVPDTAFNHKPIKLFDTFGMCMFVLLAVDIRISNSEAGRGIDVIKFWLQVLHVLFGNDRQTIERVFYDSCIMFNGLQTLHKVITPEIGHKTASGMPKKTCANCSKEDFAFNFWKCHGRNGAREEACETVLHVGKSGCSTVPLPVMNSPNINDFPKAKKTFVINDVLLLAALKLVDPTVPVWCHDCCPGYVTPDFQIVFQNTQSKQLEVDPAILADNDQPKADELLSEEMTSGRKPRKERVRLWLNQIAEVSYQSFSGVFTSSPEAGNLEIRDFYQLYFAVASGKIDTDETFCNHIAAIVHHVRDAHSQTADSDMVYLSSVALEQTLDVIRRADGDTPLSFDLGPARDIRPAPLKSGRAGGRRASGSKRREEETYSDGGEGEGSEESDGGEEDEEIGEGEEGEGKASKKRKRDSAESPFPDGDGPSSGRGRRKRGRSTEFGVTMETSSLGMSNLASEISNLHMLVTKLKESMENFESEMMKRIQALTEQSKTEIEQARTDVAQCEAKVTEKHDQLIALLSKAK
jgi:hypothetical protein